MWGRLRTYKKKKEKTLGIKSGIEPNGKKSRLKMLTAPREVKPLVIRAIWDNIF